MHTFLSVFKYEFRMSIMRRSLLMVYLFFTCVYVLMALQTGEGILSSSPSNQELLAEAAWNMFFLNMFFPVLAGVSAADRGVRDFKLGTREIIRSTNLKNRTYVLGKYFGVTLSLLVLTIAVGSMQSIVRIILFGLSPIHFFFSILAGIVINGPAIFFVTAFSLTCPLVMPLRIYQILFTGYWYWGNFIDPSMLPTVSNTLFHAAGRYSLISIFGTRLAMTSTTISLSYTLANILTLFLCAGLALTAMKRIIEWKESRL